MAETNEFFIKIGADVDDAMNKLNRLSTQLSQLASNTQRSSNQINNSMSGVSKSISAAFSSMGVALTTAGITAGIIGIGKAALTTAAELQQISVSFRVFTGSTETAEKMLAQLKEQALKSPMQFQDIAKGAQTLMQYGLTASQVVPITKNLGDISGGNADKFQRLSLAFGQVNAAGRLMAQEARQMINAGFNPLQAISDKTGQSMAVLTQKMHDGQISVRDVAEAFDSATSYGGRFFGMADEQSKTLGGAFNKMSESISFTLAKLGEDLDKTFDFRGLYEHIADLTSQIGRNFESLNGQVSSSNFWGNLLKDLLSALAIGMDILIKAFKGAGMAFEDFNNLFKSEESKNWLRELDLGIAGLFGTKARAYVKGFQDYLDSFNKKDSGESIIKRQMRNSGMRKITDKSYLASFSDTPSKKQSTGKKAERIEIITGTDFQTKEYGTHLKKLQQMSADAVSEINNIGLKGSKKKLADLADAFNKEKAEFQRYGVDTANITRLYLLKVAQLQGEIEAERKGALMKLIKPLPGMEGGMLGSVLSDEQLAKFAGNTQIALDNAQYFADKIKNSFLEAGRGIRSAVEEMTQSVASSFADMFSVLGQGGNAEDAIRSFASGMLSALGDMFIKIGVGIVMASKAMIAVQAFLTSMFTPAGAAAGLLGGLAMMAIGGLLKGVGSALSKPKDMGTSGGGTQSVAQKSSGSNYSYGGSSYSTQTLRLAIDLTGAITATQTGYQINKSLETTLRVTGRQ